MKYNEKTLIREGHNPRSSGQWIQTPSLTIRFQIVISQIPKFEVRRFKNPKAKTQNSQNNFCQTHETTQT
jgi:hypothetical protein